MSRRGVDQEIQVSQSPYTNNFVEDPKYNAPQVLQNLSQSQWEDQTSNQGDSSTNNAFKDINSITKIKKKKNFKDVKKIMSYVEGDSLMKEIAKSFANDDQEYNYSREFRNLMPPDLERSNTQINQAPNNFVEST